MSIINFVRLILIEKKKHILFLSFISIETLRKYPPVANLTRGTQKDYPVPGTKFIIEKGTQVWIPIYAIQHDPEYYPDPEKFDPERFKPEEVAKRDSVLWLPFGEGPRNCIGILLALFIHVYKPENYQHSIFLVGLRFGMMQTRVGLIMLLLNFEFSPSSKTTIPLKLAKKGFILSPEGGMWLKMKKITT